MDLVEDADVEKKRSVSARFPSAVPATDEPQPVSGPWSFRSLGSTELAEVKLW